MAAYAILDIDIFDIAEYLQYQKAIRSMLQRVGADYLARGGEFRQYEGDYEPRRLVVIQFPDLETMDDFYASDEYLALKSQRDNCSNTRIIGVNGL